MFSQILGTALGDWTADSAGLGYKGSAAIFGLTLLFIATAYFTTKISRTLLFWAAFVLTRPIGAVLSDLLDKPLVQGGFNLSRYQISGLLFIFIIIFILISNYKPRKFNLNQ